LAYDGNAEALVDEAISIAGFQVTQRILDNRMPLATVMIAPLSGEIRLRGGTVIGIKSGMEMVCVRQESVTGIIRVIDVTPTECTCDKVVDYKGIAPGDWAVPRFTLSTMRITPVTKHHMEDALGMVIGVALLWAVIGHSNSLDNSPSGISAAPLADAVAVTSINGSPYTYGGNLITWKPLETNILGYVIYRDVAGQSYPIAVVPASTTSFIDPGGPPPTAVATTTNGVTTTAEDVNAFTTVYTYTITTDSFPVVLSATAVPGTAAAVDITQPLPASLATSVDASAVASVVVTALNLPLASAQVASYRVQSIYWNYYSSTTTTTTGQSTPVPPTGDAIFLGTISSATSGVQVLQPPVMSWPPTGAGMDGKFQCAKVAGGTSYVLQVSSSPTYATQNTVTISAAPVTTQPTLEEADFTVAQMLASTQLQGATTVYIRMGVISVNDPTPVAELFNFYNGYVFSSSTSYSLAQGLMQSRLIRTGPVLPGQAKASLGRLGLAGDGPRGNTGRLTPY
jgi:hypothetical protein